MSKKYIVLIDPLAKKDLEDIFIYVALNDSFDSANTLLNSLEAACYKLEKYPLRGHVPQELLSTGIKKYLEIHYKPYRIIYEVDEKKIYIHTVLDGRRNIQEILTYRILR